MSKELANRLATESRRFHLEWKFPTLRNTKKDWFAKKIGEAAKLIIQYVGCFGLITSLYRKK